MNIFQSIENKTQCIHNRGKIQLPLLIAGFAIVAFFALVIWLRAPSFFAASTDLTIPGSVATSTLVASTTNPISSSSTAVSPFNPGTTGASTPVTAPPVKPNVTVGHAVGIAGGSNLSKFSEAELNKQLDQMVELGIKWVRFDIEWGNVQYGSSDKSDWKSYDTLVNAINTHHLKGLGVILFTPQWARDPKCGGGAKCPPKDPAAYAKFAAEVAARYKGKGVHAWEIWNEPNSYDFWATKTDCHAYTALLKATYPAIKRADPTAIIVTGGTAPLATDKNNISQLDFMTCIYKDGGQGSFDAVGIHPYTYPALPSSSNSNAWARMSKTSPNLRGMMIENGDAGKKIWITEFGVPTGGPDPKWYVSEEVQTQTVTDTMQMYKTYDWAGPIFWYSLKDAGITKDTNENFFGLVHNDGSPKPAFNTLKAIISSGL